MTREVYEAALMALRASPFAAATGGVEESDYSVRSADGSASAYRRASLRVVVTTGAEAAAVAAAFAALAMSIGNAGVSLYVTGPDRGTVEIAVSRDLDADESARLAGDGARGWEHPAETTRCADVVA